MNYEELKATVQTYAENTFPESIGSSGLTSTEQLDTFIRQAEQRVFNSVQLLELRKNVTGNATANNRYLAAPSDWLANYSLAVIDPVTGGYEYLLNKDVEYIREAFPYPATTGKPTHYAMFDEDTYLLGPTPDDDYDVELYYFYYPESIVDAGTSWLGDNFDSVLLYGTLLEAYTQMKGEADIITHYKARYDEAMAMLINLASGKDRTDTYRTRQFRIAPK